MQFEDVHHDGDRFELPRRRLLQGAGLVGTLAMLPDGTFAATGSSEVVVRAADVDPGVLPLDADHVDELRARARESQRPIVEWADGRDDVAVKNRFWLSNSVLLEVDGAETLEELVAVDGVEELHENFEFEIPDPTAVEPADSATTYGVEQVRAPTVWEEFETRGDGASIAVLDTGVDPDHPDVDVDDDRFVAVDGAGEVDRDAEPEDSGFHGTHVSGTVVGGDASGEYIGVAPEATLYHALVLPGGGGTFAQIIGGMEWAVEEGVDAMNMSLGASGLVPEMIEPVRNAVDAGVVVVAAAGNGGAGTASTPGAVYDAFAIGASDEDGAIADFSSGRTIDTDDGWGFDAPDDWPDEYVVPDVSAPGVDVLSAFPADADSPPGFDPVDDEWIHLSGTSMAAPHVAGAVALMRSAAEEAGEAFTPERAETALSTTAFVPDGEDEGQDIRYGFGVVDAFAATSRFAADTGVEGTVTDTDGDPIEGATVELDGFPEETGADGHFLVRAEPGTYELTADAFGYGRLAETVEVVDEAFTEGDFALEDALDVDLLQGQPAGIEADDVLDVVVRVANAEWYTVELADVDGAVDPDAVTVAIGDETIEFGEPVAVADARATVTVTVDPDEEARGLIELEHTFEGLGDVIELTTGPTEVFEEFVRVAVVDRENGVYTADMVGLLGETLGPVYELSSLEPADALEAAEEGEVDAFVVQSLGDDDDLIAEFVETTAIPQLGTVYLGQAGGSFEEVREDGVANDAIFRKSEATGDPREALDLAVEGSNPPVRYEITGDGADHPIVEEADLSVVDGDEGDLVTLYAPQPLLFFGGFHAAFEDYDGEVGARTLADVTVSPIDPSGAGLAADDFSRTVLAASLGFSAFVTRRVFRSDARELLASSVRWAADAPPATVLEDQAERIDAGGTAAVEFGVGNLLEYEVSLTDDSTLDADVLTASLDGDEIDFDEPIAFDEFTGELTLTIDVAADAVGRFALAHRFVARDVVDFEEVEVEETAITGPTAVYTPPLAVPDDLASVNDAVDLAIEGEEIVVADGVYRENDEDDVRAGVLVDTPGVTIRAAEGAEPSVVYDGGVFDPDAIKVTVPGVTIEGLECGGVDGEQEASGYGITIVGADDVTVRDVATTGVYGIRLDGSFDVENLTVEDVTAYDAIIGVGTGSRFFGDVRDATVAGFEFVDRPDFTFRGGIMIDRAADGVTVVDSYFEIEDGENAIDLEGPFGGGAESLVANNTIVGDDIRDGPGGFAPVNCGILVDDVEAIVEDNEIVDTGVGVHVGDHLGFGDSAVVVRDNEIDVNVFGYRQIGDYATVERNVIDAEVGVQLGDEDADPGDLFGPIEADQALVRYNDLSASDLPLRGEPAEPFLGFDGPLLFDCRQNYLGDRDVDEAIVEGDVAYDPFLTEPPAAVEFPDPTAIGTDLYLEAGETYGLGVPGPSDLTVWDVLGVEGGHEAFDGTVERWDEAREEWLEVVGVGHLADQDGLVGFRVEPATDVRAVLDFQFREDARDVPPGRRDRDLGEIEVEAGTNVVCAAAYGGDELFDDGSATIEAVEEKDLTAPTAQLGEKLIEKSDADEVPEAEKRPFSAYYVEVAAAGTIECDLDAYDPTMADVYEAFGFDDADVHDDPGVGSAAAVAVDALPTVDEVLEVVDGDADEVAVVDAVEAVLTPRVADAVESADDVSAVDAVETVLEETTADRPDDEVVEAAAVRAFQRVFGVAAVDPDADETEIQDDAVAMVETEADGTESSIDGIVTTLFGD